MARFWQVRLGMALVCLWAAAGLKADEFERAPISYSQSEANNRLSRLQAKLNEGSAKLAFDDKFGYLPALLEALEISPASQMLVFSKTSLQRHRISPRTPRAIYFSDDVYVGYCHAGDMLEISAVDAQLGAVFYTLDQNEDDVPRFERQTDRCLQCHASSRTENIPGHLVRSLFVQSDGQPIFSEGSHSVDHTTPLEHRWGGWYVTGRHGEQTHLGNLAIRGRQVERPIDNAQGQNVTDLSGRFPVERYLTPHSDLVALMVLEHQVLVHNRLARASYVARQALHYEAEFNKSVGEDPANRLESTTRRIQNAADKLVEALLFVDEAPLTEKLAGTSDFADQFARRGPFDARGRSLRQFDLERRIFKYPCSYLIYSEAFDELHPEMRSAVWRRLWEVLASGDGAREADKFEHLSVDDRAAIVEILRETKTEQLPDYWRNEPATK